MTNRTLETITIAWVGEYNITNWTFKDHYFAITC